MSAERNKQIIQRVFDDGVNRGNHAVIEAAFAERNQWYVSPSIVVPWPPDVLNHTLDQLRAILPDLTARVIRIVGEGDTVTTLEHWTGTELTNGTAIEGTTFHLFRFEDDQVVEEWSAGFEWADGLVGPG